MKKPEQLQFYSGLILLFILGGAGGLSLFWTPYDYNFIDISARLSAPGTDYLLGSDAFGRDVLSLLMVGARYSLMIAFCGVLLGVLPGVGLGLFAAAHPGFWDQFFTRINDVVFAFPALLTAIMLAAVYGPGPGGAIIAIGLFNIPVFARVSRALALVVWQRDFILAARLAGRQNLSISFVHILPNIANGLVVQISLQLAVALLIESGLSYLGLGVQPPAPSWGRMLADAQSYLFHAPSLVIYPGLAIGLGVLGFNLLGDGLRDRLDSQA